MPLKIRSFRGRFLVTAAVLIILTLPAGIYTQYLVTHATNEGTVVSNGHRSLQLTLDSFEQSIQATESALYHYTLALDDSMRQQIINLLGAIKLQSRSLRDHELVTRTPALKDSVDQLQAYLIELDVQIRELLHVLASVETRYPAAPILLNRLQPTGAEFSTALEQAIEESREMKGAPQQANIDFTLREIRYAWAQQISSVGSRN